ncbi:MAG: tetratricopeptide repeat protein [Xanthomonadales bacterium]|nr:tetratricopeptide repeat protein [Xanthomonadales bacterium]
MKKRPLFSWLKLSAELKRRRVYPVIGAYAVVGWIILQVGEVTFEPLDIPGWVMTALIITVVLGFPVVLVLSWLYDLTSAGIRRDPGDTSRTDGQSRKHSIAVLPFRDLSPGADQGYFCEGIAEAVLNALTQIPDFKVAARSSSFQFSGRSRDAKEIGRSLGVRALLDGSVRKPNNHFRISVQLVTTSDGYCLWSESYDSELTDILDIQDRIATGVAAALLSKIRPMQPPSTRLSRNVTAYDYYLRGRQYLKRFSKNDLESARQMFRQSIAADPQFALAFCGCADCYSLLLMYHDPNPDYRESAMQASRRALELDSNLAEAHASSGLALLVNAEYEKAEIAFRQSLELNPKLYEGYYYYARTRFHQGDLEMAAELYRRAGSVDPEDYSSRCLRVQILRGTGKSEEAYKEARKAVSVVERNLRWNPDIAAAYYLGASSLIVLGEIERAKKWLRHARKLDPDDSVLLYNLACNYATIGDLETAYSCLVRALDHGVINSVWMRHDNDLSNLRGDPEYAEKLDRLEQSAIRAPASSAVAAS